MEDKDYMITQPTTNSFFQAVAGGSFAVVSYLVGGVDNLIVALGLFMMVDYITGVMVGFTYKNLSSQRAYRGVFKKVGMLLMILVAVQIDIVTGNDDNFLRNAIIMILLGTEGISFVENLGKLGVPIPAILTDSLEQLTKGMEVKKYEQDAKDVVEKKKEMAATDLKVKREGIVFRRHQEEAKIERQNYEEGRDE